jgi:hypothetical protein
VDIIDSHDLFKNQWRKRKTFYKRENYKIIYTTSVEYTPDTSKWSLIYSPNPNGPKECKKSMPSKKTTSKKSNSSSDRSITNDSDSEEEPEVVENDLPKDKYACGVCLLKFKK